MQNFISLYSIFKARFFLFFERLYFCTPVYAGKPVQWKLQYSSNVSTNHKFSFSADNSSFYVTIYDSKTLIGVINTDLYSKLKLEF